MSFDSEDVHEEVAAMFDRLGGTKTRRALPDGFEVYESLADVARGDVKVTTAKRRTKGDGLKRAARTVQDIMAAEARRNACILCGREGRPRDDRGRCRGQTGCKRSRLSQLIQIRAKTGQP